MGRWRWTTFQGRIVEAKVAVQRVVESHSAVDHGDEVGAVADSVRNVLAAEVSAEVGDQDWEEVVEVPRCTVTDVLDDQKGVGP